MNPLVWLAAGSIVWGGVLCLAAMLLQRNSNLSGRMRQWTWRSAMVLLIAPWLAAPVVSAFGLGLAPAETVAVMASAGAPLDAPTVVASLDQASPAVAWVVREDSGWIPQAFSLTDMLLLIVMLGWVVRFVLAQLSARTLIGIVANSQTAGAGPARKALEAWSARLKLRRQPDLRFAPGGVSPFSYGILRPVIVLPEGLDQKLDAKALDLVVGHECLHVARGDGWLRPLERVVADVMWFNPFAWVMRREADISRELAVDEGVVEISDARRAYARALRDVAGLAVGLPVSLPAASMSLAGSGKSLMLRMKRTLALAKRKPARSAIMATVALGIAGACTSVGQAMLVTPAAMPAPQAVEGAATPAAMIYAPVQMRVTAAKSMGSRGEMKLSLESTATKGLNADCEIKVSAIPDVKPGKGDIIEEGALIGQTVAGRRSIEVAYCDLDSVALKRLAVVEVPVPSGPVDIVHDQTRAAPVALLAPVGPATLASPPTPPSYAPATPAQDAEYRKQRHRHRTEPDYQGADLVRTQYQPQAERPPILFKLPDGKPVISGSARLSSGYGYRIDPFTTHEAFHSGVDIAAAFGTPVHAPTSGTVTFAGVSADHGRTVEVAMLNGSTLRFGHLNDISVAVGAKIAAGSQVGTVGMDGQSTGAHVHFEIIRDGQAIDPASVGDLVMIGPA